MEKGDLVLGRMDGGDDVYGIILWANVLFDEDPCFTIDVGVLWQDGVISNEFSGELRLFI